MWPHCQESVLAEEIARFGTHESPFTRDDLDALLEQHGFRDVLRYHAINGFFPEDMGGVPLAEAVQSRAENSNNLVARKPAFEGPTTTDADAETRGRIDVLASRFHPEDRKLDVTLRLANVGDTVRRHRPRGRGWVSVAVRSDPIGAADYREARPRHRLPREVPPGDAVTLEAEFFFDLGYESRSWRLDLVNEGLFWFSQRGTDTPSLDLS